MAPSLVIALIAGLPDTSNLTASIRGGPEYRGWGLDREIAALQYDALNQNTLASGNWAKGKQPKLKPFPRPGVEAKKKPLSLRALWRRVQPTSN